MGKRHQFEFTKKAEQEFAALEKSLQKRIYKKLLYFESLENPLLSAKKLAGAENRFRFRVGDYRIIVALRDANTFVILIILKIGHRREVYEIN